MESIRNKPYYKVIVWVGIILGLFVLSQQVSFFSDPDLIAANDFVQYWASGRLLLQGGNPYDAAQMKVLHDEVGRTDFDVDTPTLMWYPPWTMPLVIPFGLFLYGMSRFLWFLVHLVLIFACLYILWHMYGGADKRVWWALLAGFVFSPVLTVLHTGQIGAFLLVGCVGFLYFARESRWWLAGAFAALLTIKPHLLYLFWIALLLWALKYRNLKVVLGVVVVILASIGVSMAFNPRLIQNYLYAVRTYPPVAWITPTIGAALRLLFGAENFWMQFISPVLGAVWLVVFYWRKHKETWNWQAQLPILILVSVVTAAYGWTHDQVVLVVATIQAMVWLERETRSSVKIATLVSYLALSVLHLSLVKFTNLSVFGIIWLAPGWLIWYLTVRRLCRANVIAEQAIS